MVRNILVVEDDLINCLIYKKILSNELIEYDFAYDGESGLSKYELNDFSLILLDIGLPKMNGITVARSIRAMELLKKTKKRIPIIVITADNSEPNRLSALEAGADEFMTKPFNKRELIELINKYTI